MIYYLSSIRNLIGYIVVIILFNNYYHIIIEIDKSTVINNIFTLIIITYILLCVRNLIVNLVMRKRLIDIFKNNINLILQFKQLIHDLSYNKTQYYNHAILSTKTVHNINNTNISSWKLIKLKNAGFEYWEKGSKLNIYTKKKMINVSNVLWNYLLEKYSNTTEFKTLYSNINNKDKIIINRIPTKFVMDEININSDDINYNIILKLFDSHGYTFISENDFKNAIIKMFQQWKESNTFLVGYNNLSTVIQYVMSFITYFVVLIISLNIFNISLSSVFVPLATIIVTISFTVSRVLGNIASNIVFIVFIEPYKIGQRVFIANVSDSNLIVTDIRISTTIFREILSGKLIYVPNHQLYDMNIINHHESKKVIFNLTFKIKCNTPNDKIDKLTQMLDNYLQLHPNEWKPNADLYIDTIEHDKNIISICYWVQHFSHWGDSVIYDSKTKLMIFMHETMKQLKIEYVAPTIPIMKLKEE